MAVNRCKSHRQHDCTCRCITSSSSNVGSCRTIIANDTRWKAAADVQLSIFHSRHNRRRRSCLSRRHTWLDSAGMKQNHAVGMKTFKNSSQIREGFQVDHNTIYNFSRCRSSTIVRFEPTSHD